LNVGKSKQCAVKRPCSETIRKSRPRKRLLIVAEKNPFLRASFGLQDGRVQDTKPLSSRGGVPDDTSDSEHPKPNPVRNHPPKCAVGGVAEPKHPSEPPASGTGKVLLYSINTPETGKDDLNR